MPWNNLMKKAALPLIFCLACSALCVLPACNGNDVGGFVPDPNPEADEFRAVHKTESGISAQPRGYVPQPEPGSVED